MGLVKISNLRAWKWNTNFPKTWFPLEWNKIVNTPQPGGWPGDECCKDRMALAFHPLEALEKGPDWERRDTGCRPAAPADEERSSATASPVAQWPPKESWGGSQMPEKAPSTSRCFPLLCRSSCREIIFMCQRLGHDLHCWQLGTFDRKQKLSLTMLLWELWINHFHVQAAYTQLLSWPPKSLQTFEPVKSHSREEQFVEKLEATKVNRERTFEEKNMKIFYFSCYPYLSFNDKNK